MEPADVGELARVGEVLAIPCQKEIALVKGSKREVQRVAQWIARHEAVRNVRLDNFHDFVADRHRWQGECEVERLCRKFPLYPERLA